MEEKGYRHTHKYAAINQGGEVGYGGEGVPPHTQICSYKPRGRSGLWRRRGTSTHTNIQLYTKGEGEEVEKKERGISLVESFLALKSKTKHLGYVMKYPRGFPVKFRKKSFQRLMCQE